MKADHHRSHGVAPATPPELIQAAAHVLLFAVLTSGPTAGQDTAILRPGPQIERQLDGGITHTWAAALSADAAWRIAVEQMGINVVVEVTDPEGADVITVDSPAGRRGVESLVVRPGTSGRYTIAIRSQTPTAAPGRYQILLEELEDKTSEERRRLDAELAVTEAGRLFAQGSAREATDEYRRASAHWRALGVRHREAEAVQAIAVISWRIGETRPAIELFQQTLALWEELGEAKGVARTLSNLGLAHWDLSELEEARGFLDRALTRYRAMGDRFGEAVVLGNRCLVIHSTGELRSALRCYRDALGIFEELGNSERQATQLNNIGFAYYSLGEPREAIDHYQRALEIRRTLGDLPGEAQSLNNIAVVLRGLGELQEALAYFGKVREILGPLENHRREASALHNMGVAYLSLGEADRAQVYLREALALRRQIEDKRGEISTLSSLARTHRARGGMAAALALRQRALELARATSDRRNEAIMLSHLGDLQVEVGELTRGLQTLEQATELLHEIGDRYREALARHRQGNALLALGKPREALASLDQALALRRALGDRAGEAASLFETARAQRLLGNLDNARLDLEGALDIVESLRSAVDSPGLRASFLDSWQPVYVSLIDLLMELHAADPTRGSDRAALAVSERARARTLLDLLGEDRAALRHGIAPTLRERRGSLERRLKAKADRRQSRLARVGPEDSRATILEQEIQEILAELDVVDAEIRRSSPAYATLLRPEPVDPAEIQGLLDPDTVLVEYALGETRSFAWVVQLDSLAAFELAPRAEIEAAARLLHQRFSTPDPRAVTRTQDAASALSRLILEPIWSNLGGRRLVVVADGALHYIPFAALPVPDAESPPAQLISRYEIVHLPSASSLVHQRRQPSRRSHPAGLAAIFADPIFDRRDPRLSTVGKPEITELASGGLPQPGDKLRSLRQAPGALDRLPLTRGEALAIARLAPEGQVLTALDFAASRETVMNGALRDYRILHFATHGLLDSSQPELSGLVLSLLDKSGRPQEGILSLRDVFTLELSADLVVLSGCQTALGKELRGEGLVGLTRGFMYAGAPRVVASLWWVQDRATAELMTHFYRSMWAAGLKPAAALRQAQLAMLRERRWQDAFYWAAFVYQGDWR